MVLSLGSGALSEIVIIAVIAVALYIILKLAKTFMKFIFGIIINSVLGVMFFIILNYFFNFGITLTWQLIVPLAIFGLPAAGTIVLLKLLAVSI